MIAQHEAQRSAGFGMSKEPESLGDDLAACYIQFQRGDFFSNLFNSCSE